MKSILIWWHERKLRKAKASLGILAVKVSEYERAERNYRSSRYTDMLHEALFSQRQQQEVFDHHKQRLDSLRK